MRSRPWASYAVVALGLFGAAVLGLASAAGYGGKMVVLVVGVPLLIASFVRPLFGAVVTLMLVATFFDEYSLPSVGLGGIDLRPPEVLSVIATLGAIYRADAERLRAVGLPLILLGAFATMAVVATVFAITLGYVKLFDAAQGIRALVYLGLAVVIALVQDARTLRRLFDALLAMSAAVGLAAIAASVLPAAADVANTLANNAAVTPDDQKGFASLLRVRMPGLALCYAILLPGIGLILVGHRRGNLLRIAALVLVFSAIVVSFNRNQWVGAILGVLTATLLGSPALRRKLVGSLFPLAALSLIGLSLLLVRSDASAAVFNRFESLVRPTSVVESSSIRTRQVESGLAITAIKEHPVMGLGAGSDYGNVVTYGSTGLTSTPAVHNQYLEIALHYGIPALLVFLAACGAAMWRGLRTARHGSRLSSFLAAMSVGSVIAVLASSVVAMYLTPPHTMASLAVLFGLLLVRPNLEDDPVSPETAPASAPG